MVSALGRIAEQFAEIKPAVGSSAWAALCLGVPSEPKGGLIKRDWLDQWRLPVAPAICIRWPAVGKYVERERCGS
ncbi:hypothetical protein ACVWWN_000269 [Mycobacterium sp. URHB0021]